MANRSSRTPKKDEAFFSAVRQGQSISAACLVSGYGKASVYEWRQSDSEFARVWDEAQDEGTDRLEDEAYRRACQGTTKPVYQGGVRVGEVQEFSDTLMIFMLKARRPERFKDRAAVEHTGKDGGPIQTKDVTSRDRAKAVAALVAKNKAGGGRASGA